MPLLDFISIIRPVNCAMAAFGTFIGYSIASPATQLNPQIGIAMAVAFLVCAAGMVINDYFDRHVDKRLNPGKPLPSGKISPKTALCYAIVLFIAGNALALYFLPAISAAIALAFSVLLIVYSAFLSKAKFVGNVVVALGTAFTLVFGASLIGKYEIVAFLAIAALFANLARELIKDLQDVKQDTGFKKSLPMLLSEKKVIGIVFFYYLIAIIAVYAPLVLFGFALPAFAAIVSIANLLFLLSFYKTVKKQFGKAQAISKAAMLIALLGFLAGVL